MKRTPAAAANKAFFDHIRSLHEIVDSMDCFLLESLSRKTDAEIVELLNNEMQHLDIRRRAGVNDRDGISRVNAIKAFIELRDYESENNVGGISIT